RKPALCDFCLVSIQDAHYEDPRFTPRVLRVQRHESYLASVRRPDCTDLILVGRVGELLDRVTFDVSDPEVLGARHIGTSPAKHYTLPIGRNGGLSLVPWERGHGDETQRL